MRVIVSNNCANTFWVYGLLKIRKNMQKKQMFRISFNNFNIGVKKTNVKVKGVSMGIERKFWLARLQIVKCQHVCA